MIGHVFKPPEPLRGQEDGTWAQSTIVKRLPDIAGRVLAENSLSGSVVKQIKDLIAQLPHGQIRFLEDLDAPDALNWERYVTARLGQNWLEVPFLFAETYFYRRILEATGYFKKGDDGEGADPFHLQKQRGLETSNKEIALLCARRDHWQKEGTWQPEVFIELLIKSLWGNQADLSLWPAEKGKRPRPQESQFNDPRILVDHKKAIAEYLSRKGPVGKMHLVADNAGFELVCDLCLVDYLLSTDETKTLYLHLKAHPTFVSDATIKDVMNTQSRLKGSKDPATRRLGLSLENHLDSGALRLQDNYFWTSPLAFWDLPKALQDELEQGDLVLFKGDANYRRLIGDLHWAFTTPFTEIVGWPQSSIVALRSLKSEVVVGLEIGQAETITQVDRNWMTDGKWGMIQFKA